MIPDITGLREDLKSQAQSAGTGELSDDELIAALQQQYPEQYAKFTKLPPEQQSRMLEQLRGAMGQQGGDNIQTQEVGDI